jgi:uncharacterized protein
MARPSKVSVPNRTNSCQIFFGEPSFHVEIWRYPISSVGGERMERAKLSPEGVEGDRQYGLIDAATGLPAVPEKDARWRKALHLQAAYIEGTLPTISFPDGQSYLLDDRSLNAVLTDYFGFAAAIAAYDHSKRRLGFPLTKFRHRHFAMHMLTTASLGHLASFRHAAIDRRRLRPTVLIEVRNSHGFVENEWIGRCLQLGPIELTAQQDTKRCGVTFLSQPGLAEDPEILRSILRHNNRTLGIYCSIDGTGSIQLGDEFLVDV